ncbi:MAG: hypothetical protein CMB20_003675 [Methanobacteriota archaeon]|nr:MAG: hypothetical protein CMB20_003675 [Euryarchaeota archaeon]
MIVNPSAAGFKYLDLRYMQLEISIDSAKDLPGSILPKYFVNSEFVSKIRITDEGLDCYLKIDFVDEASLDVDHPTLKIKEIISKSGNSALVKACLSGPIPVMFFDIPDVWWVYPTKLDEKKFTITVRGTTAALRQVRNGFKNLVGNGFTVKLGSESLQGPEFEDILPEKQRLVLDTAIEMGYYSRPRRCTQREIASVLNIKQATVSEHLQSAESKIINTFHS